MPSLVIRDGRSMRYQYAGRLKENDIAYLFVTPTFIPLLDRLFATRAELDPMTRNSSAHSPSRRIDRRANSMRPMAQACCWRAKRV